MSNEPKWTKAPWEAKVTIAKFGGWKEPEQIISIWAGGALIAHYGTSSSEYPSRASCKASARLIAASPTMHAEMSRYLEVLERAEADPEIWAKLTDGTGIATANGYRAALAKAVQS